MAWYKASGSDFLVGGALTAADMNALAQQFPTWQGDVNGNTKTLSNLGQLKLSSASATQVSIAGGGASKLCGMVVNNLAGDPTQGGLTIQRLSATGVYEANLMTVNLANGYVGIGTASPTEALDVAGGGLCVRGQSTNSVANSVKIDASPGLCRLIALGPSAAAHPTFQIVSVRSDSTDPIVAFSIGTGGWVAISPTTPTVSPGMHSKTLWVDAGTGIVHCDW